MVNIKNITISNDGNLKRVSASYDMYDENGKMTRTNIRISRAIVANGELEKEIADVTDYITKLIEEES